MVRIIAAALGLLILAGAGAASAQFDGSVPLVCAIVDVEECDARAGCEAREVEDVDLSQFLRVDAAGKKLSSMRPGEERRESEIHHVGHEGGNLVLQGAEGGRGWTMVIVQDTGKMSGALTTSDAVFVVFGACTPD